MGQHAARRRKGKRDIEKDAPTTYEMPGQRLMWKI